MAIGLFACSAPRLAGQAASSPGPAQSPPPLQPLSLEVVVREALRVAPGFQAIRSAHAAAVASARRERPVARPTVTMQAAAGVQGPAPATRQPATFLPGRTWSVGLSAEQRLLHAGAADAAARYRSLGRVADAEAAMARIDALHEVRLAYIAAHLADQMVAIADAGVVTARMHLALVKEMAEAGQMPRRDIDATDAEVAEAEQGLIRACNGRRLARGNLARLMGRMAPVQELLTDPALAPVPASACRPRPEITLIEAQLAAARSGAKLAATQCMPELAAVATASAQPETPLIAPTYAALGLRLTWRLLDGGAAQIDQAEARARAAQLASLLEETRRSLALQWDRSVADAEDAVASLRTAERQAASAHSALEVTLARYRERMAPEIELSGARLAVDRAQGNVAQAKAALQTAYADQRHAAALDADPPQAPQP